ncbi:MAG: cytochrome c biogenesis ATP-binding export protein CcmA [Lysobacteraceae bacterium]|nr:MAG: cytochrome c biogenesis ATP-binding export protein CcmA [Xanthomonadaceae bacterium]
MARPTLLSPALLEARGLSYHRNEERIFGPLDLRVEPGEALLVEGGNGSGKTTLLRVLAGLLRASEGEVAHPALADRGRGALALLGHALALKAELSCIENLRFAAGLFGRRHDRTAEGCLEEAGLAGYEDQLAARLSAGQRKRLALARLRLGSAPLWLLDEPFANLDLAGIDLVHRLIQSHLAEGGGALLTSHGAYPAGSYRYRVQRLDALP